jgi:chorismate mutase
MKNNEYLIVHKSILPEYFDQVIVARELIVERDYSVTEACKLNNISRSTYYKYKDYIFNLNKDSGSQILFSIKTIDEKGILSSILKIITESNGNVITINQDHPIDGSAYINVLINTDDLSVTIEELKNKINEISGVKSIDIALI